MTKVITKLITLQTLSTMNTTAPQIVKINDETSTAIATFLDMQSPKTISYDTREMIPSQLWQCQNTGARHGGASLMRRGSPR